MMIKILKQTVILYMIFILAKMSFLKLKKENIR